MTDPAAPRLADLLDRRDLLALGGIVLLGAVVRLLFVQFTELPPFDPWRHLQLIENLRRGAGFTLFDGQPYLWYSPVWYRLCAALPGQIGPAGLAALFSLLAAPAVYLLLRITGNPAQRLPAASGGLLMALCGPLVAYTCHYGPEGLALFLTLSALMGCALSRHPANAMLCGLAFGVAVVLRTNFAFDLLLFLPLLPRRARLLAFGGGLTLPLAATWWRNHLIIAGHEYVFTWDGLATRSADFSPLSTIVVQLHPAVQEGLRRLHEAIIPAPEWLRGPDGIAWEHIVFMLGGLLAVALSRRRALIATATLTLAYFLLLDRSMSSNFFRIYLPLFPVLFLAVAHLASRRPRLAVALAVAMLISGAPSLSPPGEVALSTVTPPPGLLAEEAFMVNSGFYHPESLIRRYPEKRFIGMPIDAERFEEFRALYPEYDAILWHDFSVQDEIARHLGDSGRYEVARSGVNAAGRRYRVLRPK